MATSISTQGLPQSLQFNCRETRLADEQDLISTMFCVFGQERSMAFNSLSPPVEVIVVRGACVSVWCLEMYVPRMFGQQACQDHFSVAVPHLLCPAQAVLLSADQMRSITPPSLGNDIACHEEADPFGQWEGYMPTGVQFTIRKYTTTAIAFSVRSP